MVVDGIDPIALEWTVRSLLAQRTEDRVDIVVVFASRRGRPRDWDGLGEFETVVVAPGVPQATRRRAGLDAATGDYVLFVPAGTTLLPDCIEELVRAHDRGHDVVSGTVLNATSTPIGWASYFLAHSDRLPGRDTGHLAIPPAGCSSSRDALLAGPSRSSSSPRARALVVGASRRLEPASATRPATLGRAGYAAGRVSAGAAEEEILAGPRLTRPWRRLRFVATFGPNQWARVERNVEQWNPDLAPQLRRARPWMVLATGCAWVGAMTETVRHGVIRRPVRA